MYLHSRWVLSLLSFILGHAYLHGRWVLSLLSFLLGHAYLHSRWVLSPLSFTLRQEPTAANPLQRSAVGKDGTI